MRQLRERGGVIGTHEQLLVDFLDDWLQLAKKHDIADSTFATYVARLQHIVNHIGHLQIGKLQPAHVRLMVSELQAKGMAPNTLYGTFALLRSALEQAVRDETIPRNPVSVVKPPRRKQSDVFTPTIEMFQTVLDSCQGTHWYALFLLLGSSGLRVSEALGLHWSDLDGEHLQVRHSLLYRPPGSFDLGPTKTGVARDVILTPRAVRALEAHRLIQIERQLAAEVWKDRNIVFTDDTGNYIQRTNVNQTLNRRLRKMGLPHFRVHALRHMCATLLLERGMALHAVAQQLGHSTPTTTLSQYAHVTARQAREGADLMDLILARK
jgi:integrase